MKKIALLLGIITLCLLAVTGCSAAQEPSSSVISETSPRKVYTPTMFPFTDDKGRLILKSVGSPQFEWAMDITTPEKVAKSADIIVVGKITKVEKTIYVNDVCATYLSIQCSQVIKGNPSKTFTFITMGGYMPYQEFMNRWGESAEKEYANLTKDQKNIAYFLFQPDDMNLPEMGEQYLLLLKNNGNNPPTVVGTYHGLFRIEGDKAYQTWSGGGVSLNDLLAKVR